MSLIFLFACATSAMAEAPGDPKSVKQDDKGKNLDAKGDPTFSVEPDGTVDRYTYSGFRRYHSECHVCHGPDGAGHTKAGRMKGVKDLTDPKYQAGFTDEQAAARIKDGLKDADTGKEKM